MSDHPAPDETPANVEPLRAVRPCPQCRRPAERRSPAYPFCSKRCADLDLAKWFDGTYTVPVVEADASVPDEGE